MKYVEGKVKVYLRRESLSWSHHKVIADLVKTEQGK